MILEKMNQGFPPFGGTGRGLYQPDLFADRGFTGHEFLTWFNVYNMNGRLYDPLAGRFLSADNVIQDAGYTQNYNKYSYCLNNPLKYNDPSGYRMAAADGYRNLGKEVSNYDRFYGFSSNGDYGGGGGWGGNGGALPGWAAGSNSGFFGYSYKYGKYWENLSNDEVSFDEVYNNDIVPNSTPLYSRSSGYNLTNIGYNSSTGFSLSMSNSSSFTSMSLENSLDFASIIFQTYIKAPPSPSSNGAQNSNTIDNCGVETYAWFSTKSAAEKYLKNNSGCEKEKFFYIFTTKSVLVGPWKDATRFETSPQYADKYDRKGNVIFNGTTYRVARFVHTHPDNADPSDRDHDVHNFFMNNGGSNISTEIFFDGTYYRYW